MSEAPAQRRPVILASWLVLAGILGIWAAFELTIDKILVATDPDASLSCDFSLLVTCGPNLESWQGELFGFPNPIIGLLCWPATIIVGVSLLAGARFPRWYWAVFNLGVAGALAFILFLSSASFWSIGTLCIWCMLTWAVTVPTFWAVTFRNLRAGVFGPARALRAIGRVGGQWVVVITLLSYLALAIEAQLALDVLRYLF
ncbi:MAG: vitamin K epoxide reductase family protein [Microbacteriaceae bacterium]